MRSLWRVMAAQWLGGAGSEVLTGDSALLDLLVPEQTVPAFCVMRDKQAHAPAVTAARAPEAVERKDVEHPERRRS